MDSFSYVALIVLGIVVFLRVRSGDAGDWFKAKFFNAAAPGPERPPRLRSVDGAAGGGGVIGSTGWTMPADGAIGSGFGPRKSPGGIGSTNHKGVDIGGRTGDPVRASRAGRVTYAGNSGGYGFRVDVNHGDGIVTRYAHLNRIGVRVGQQVQSGEKLGEIGATGTATGPHLHFEIRRNGVPVDPVPFLPVAVGR